MVRQVADGHVEGKMEMDMEDEKMLKSNTGTYNYVDGQLSGH